jgi:hypothetical protein
MGNHAHRPLSLIVGQFLAAFEVDLPEGVEPEIPE